MSEPKVIRLTCGQVCHIVAEYVAKHGGLTMPVRHSAHWKLEEGQLVLQITVESLPNVSRLDDKRPTLRLGKGRLGEGGNSA